MHRASRAWDQMANKASYLVDKTRNMLLHFFSFTVNFPVVSGGFALLAATGSTLAGLGGGGVGAAAATVLGAGGLVTGILPLAAAGALGVIGEKYLIKIFRKPVGLTRV